VPRRREKQKNQRTRKDWAKKKTARRFPLDRTHLSGTRGKIEQQGKKKKEIHRVANPAEEKTKSEKGGEEKKPLIDDDNEKRWLTVASGVCVKEKRKP